MGIIYDRDGLDMLGLRKDSYHKLSGDTFEFAKFLSDKNLGLSEKQLQDLILEFRGRKNKTKRDDVLDQLKDTVRKHFHQEEFDMWHRGDDSVGTFLDGAYCDDFTDEEHDRRWKRYNEFLEETNTLTDDFLDYEFSKFIHRTDIIPKIGERPKDVDWYRTKSGESGSVELSHGCITKERLQQAIDDCPKGKKALVSVLNPYSWFETTSGGNSLIWSKLINAAVAYVPEDTISDISWLSEPSS